MAVCRKCEKEKGESGMEFGRWVNESSRFYEEAKEGIAPYNINEQYFICTPCILQALGVKP